MTDMELKARHVVDVYDNYSEHPCEESSQVYLKSEVDKVIAEKNTKIIQLEALIENYNRISREIIDNANHQKYKRCLDKADRCLAQCQIFGFVHNYPKTKHYAKWHKRWLELSKKFKEAK